MKVSAYYIVHYGREWLPWSIQSIIEQVDDIHIFYTPVPSHGHSCDKPCPETRQMIHMSLWGYRFDSKTHKKIFWHDTKGFPHEGLQRHNAVDTLTAAGSDIILVVDADELWEPGVLQRALEYVKNDDTTTDYRIGMRHFWRSLGWVCDDQAMPTRILKPGNPLKGQTTFLGGDIGKVFHMGYAQSPRIIEYKQGIHGHKNEWRPGWFEDTFMRWSIAKPFGDVHPTNKDYWFPKPLYFETPATDLTAIRALCYDHPYNGGGLITDGAF